MTTGRTIQNTGDSSSFMFKNFAKNMVSYAGQSAETPPWPTKIDANGYPKSNPTGNIGGLIFVPISYSGQWVLSFDGTGEFTIASAYTLISDVDSCIIAGGNLVVRSNTASQTRGRTRVVVQFTNSPKSFSAYFPGGSTKYSDIGGGVSSMSNLVFCRASSPYGNDESDIQSGDISKMFNGDYLAVLADLNVKVLRFMGLVGTNLSNVSQYAARQPVANVTYMSRRLDPQLLAGGGCVTAGSNGTYTCSSAPITPGTHTLGEQIQVQFHAAQPVSKPILNAVLTGGTSIAITVTDASDLTTGQTCFVYAPGLTDTPTGGAGLQTAYTISVAGNVVTITGTFTGTWTSGGTIQRSPTLNVSGRGAKIIYSDAGYNIASFYPFGQIAAGASASAVSTVATLIYDDILNGWIYRPYGLGGDVGSYCPFEVCVALCNKLGMDYWHNFPHHITTASALSQATYIRDNLTSGLAVYFEYSNELWNASFLQNKIMGNRSTALGFSSGNQNRYLYWSYRYAEIMKAIGLLWSGGVILKRTIAFQGAAGSEVNTYLLTGSLLKNTSTAYWAYNPVDYSTAGNRPIDFCETLSYGNYYYGHQAFQFDAEYIGTSQAPPPLFPRNATYFAPLTTAADAFAGGDTSQVSIIDDDVRYGTMTHSPVTIASDGTFTLSTDTCTNNGIFTGSLLQLFVSVGGTLPGSLTAKTKIYYAVNVSGSTFKIALTVGGAAITGLTGGSGTFSVGLTGQNLLRWNSDRRDFWNAYGVTYNKDVNLYESAYSAWFPSTASCTTIGISTAYSQKILDLVVAWQKSTLCRDTAISAMTGFVAASKSTYPCQLQLIGLNSWSLLTSLVPPISGNSATFDGDIYCDKNGGYDAVKSFNSGGVTLAAAAGSYAVFGKAATIIASSSPPTGTTPSLERTVVALEESRTVMAVE